MPQQGDAVGGQPRLERQRGVDGEIRRPGEVVEHGRPGRLLLPRHSGGQDGIAFAGQQLGAGPLGLEAGRLDVPPRLDDAGIDQDDQAFQPPALITGRQEQLARHRSAPRIEMRRRTRHGNSDLGEVRVHPVEDAVDARRRKGERLHPLIQTQGEHGRPDGGAPEQRAVAALARPNARGTALSQNACRVAGPGRNPALSGRLVRHQPEGRHQSVGPAVDQIATRLRDRSRVVRPAEGPQSPVSEGQHLRASRGRYPCRG